MTDRYGEFVRFNPPLEPKTLLIWGAPFIMLLVGVESSFTVSCASVRACRWTTSPLQGPM